MNKKYDNELFDKINQTYNAYRNSLINSMKEANDLYIKHLVYVIGGAFLLSFALLKFIDSNYSCLWLIISSWFSLGISLTLIVTSLLFSYFAHLNHMKKLDAQVITKIKDMQNEIDIDISKIFVVKESILNKVIACILTISGGLFVLGIIFMIFFSIFNIGDQMPEKKDSESKVVNSDSGKTVEKKSSTKTTTKISKSINLDECGGAPNGPVLVTPYLNTSKEESKPEPQSESTVESDSDTKNE